MAAIVAFANQKGGVGKTTTAIHIAAAVAASGYKTLLIDLDPQGNIASGFGIRKVDVKYSIYDVLIERCTPAEAMLTTCVSRLSVIPSTLDLVGIESEFAARSGANTRLSDILTPILSDFDYIFIDCPPSLSLITLNALVAADAVVVPMTCEFYALEGLSQLHITLKKVRKLYNPRLSLAGILLTMHNPRYTLTAQVVAELRRHYGTELFKSTISRSVRLAEAPGFGRPVFDTAPTSKSAKEYKAAAKELMMRI